MDRARRGDAAAWGELYERHFAVMYALLHGRIPDELRSRFDTEEVLESGLLTAFQRIASYQTRGEEGFRTWLMTILLNKLRDRIRTHVSDKRSVFQESRIGPQALGRATDPAPSPEQMAEMAESQAHVLVALSRLEPLEQKLVTWRAVEELSWPEISARAERPVAGLQYVYYRALKRFVSFLHPREKSDRA